MNTQSQVEDLWPPDIAEQATVTPLAILREQAALLSKKTRNLVEGWVHTESSGSTNGESRIFHTFTLVVPTLDDYSYDLFRVSHSVMLYPVRVEFNSTFNAFASSVQHSLENEEEFKEWLKGVFAAPHTKRILGVLIAQAAA